MTPDSEPKNSAWPLVRDVLSFTVGAFAFVFELVSGRGVPERPYMLFVAGALMGVGPALAALTSWKKGE